MADLFTIGDETFTDERWALMSMLSYRRTHRFKKYNLANGKPKTVHEGRDPLQRMFTAVYVPSQNLATGEVWDRTFWTVGTNWYTELARLEDLGADGEPLAVTIGDVDYGEWFVEVRTEPERESHVKNPREGTVAPLITMAMITLTEVDETRTRITNNAPGTAIVPISVGDI